MERHRPDVRGSWVTPAALFPRAVLALASVSPSLLSLLGGDNLYDGIEDMIGYRPGPWMKYSWAVITPALCVVSLTQSDQSAFESLPSA